MKIVVFGASGGTGRELVRQGAALGHEVTAFVRNPASLAAQSGVRIFAGNALDDRAVLDAIAGQEAVMSALGSRSLRNNSLLPEAIRRILPSMQQHRVRRLIVLGAAGVWSGSGGKISVAGKLIVGLLGMTLLRRPFQSQRAMQELIQTSDTDWTIVQPPFLLNAPGRGVYRVDGESLPPRGMRIARADVARFMLAQLGSAEWVRKSPFIAW
ncbi:MAG TPA: SDR family oxidoreductase [Acidobacteriaceae bacterium]|nr:SDR family oxidoreductase [Acidobacteriaceae bacterium]